jgi:flagellar hook-length control protein FliK
VSSAIVPAPAGGAARNSSSSAAATPTASFADAFASLSDAMHGVVDPDVAAEDEAAAGGGRSDADLEADAAIAASALFADLVQPGPMPGWTVVAAGVDTPAEGQTAAGVTTPSVTHGDLAPLPGAASAVGDHANLATPAAPGTPSETRAPIAPASSHAAPDASRQLDPSATNIGKPHGTAQATPAGSGAGENPGGLRTGSDAAPAGEPALPDHENEPGPAARNATLAGAPGRAATAAETSGSAARQRFRHTIERLRADASSDAAPDSRAANAPSRPAPIVSAIPDKAAAEGTAADSTGPATRPVPAAAIGALTLAATAREQRDGAPSGHGSGAAHHGGLLHIAPSNAPAVMAVPFPSLTGTGAATELPPETGNQIVQSLRLLFARDGGEAHIKLDPRQFGDVTVRVKVDQGQVVARVEADAPVVREWLQSNQNLLRQGLAGQHLALDRLDVVESPSTSDAHPEDDRSNADQQRERQHRQEQQRRRRAATSAIFDIVA